MRRFEPVHALIIVLAAGCGGPSTTDDAGTRDAGDRVDAPAAVQCEREDDCLDSLYCTVHRCRPGAPGADARGCVLEGDPCGDGERCVESESTCVAEECGADPDRDGDGRPSLACGGFDCDDDDEHRFPGNPEVCDAEGHDEDCNLETIAGAADADVDGDGFTSAMCCNGAICGDDCDDTDPATHPGARELCNGRDDDCDGSVDEAGATPLCPGGTCTAGRCSLVGWDRTFGGASFDRALSVAMDDLGNVYVTGTFTASARFGAAGGPVASVAGSADIFVASYAPDGAFRWVRTFGSPDFDQGLDIAYDVVSSQVYVSVLSSEPIDFGGGVTAGSGAQTVVVALTSEGTYAWDRTFPFVIPTGAVSGRDGLVVGGTFHMPHDFGGGTRTPRGTDGFIAHYASDGTYRWEATFPSSGYALPIRLHAEPSGRVLAAGQFSGVADFGAGERSSGGGPSDAFVVALDVAGAHLWDYTAGSAGRDFANVVASDAAGRPYVVGAFEGTVDFGAGPELAPAGQSAFLLALDPAGSLRAITTWGGGATNEAIALGVDSAGNPLVAGYFEGTVDFGGGARTAPTGGEAAFYVAFDSLLNHRYDSLFTYPGVCPSTRCTSVAGDLAIGPADSTVITGEFRGSIDFGSGARTSSGENDGFIVRLPR